MLVCVEVTARQRRARRATPCRTAPRARPGRRGATLPRRDIDPNQVGIALLAGDDDDRACRRRDQISAAGAAAARRALIAAEAAADVEVVAWR